MSLYPMSSGMMTTMFGRPPGTLRHAPPAAFAAERIIHPDTATAANTPADLEFKLVFIYHRPSGAMTVPCFTKGITRSRISVICFSAKSRISSTRSGYFSPRSARSPASSVRLNSKESRPLARVATFAFTSTGSCLFCIAAPLRSTNNSQSPTRIASKEPIPCQNSCSLRDCPPVSPIKAFHTSTPE